MSNSTGNFNLDKFDMKRLIKNAEGKSVNPRIAIIAKSGSGKSVIIKDIMNEFYKENIPCGIVIAPTDKVTKFYDDFIPPVFIYHEYEDHIISRFFKRQNKKLDENQERIKMGKSAIDTRAYFIMDDCMSTKKLWLNNPLILSIFNEGRHYQFCPFILSMQYCLGIEPELRNNFDYIFLLGEDTHSSKKKIHEHYAGIFKTYDHFDQVFSQVTDNYGCMVIDNRLRSSDITKKVFWYKARIDIPEFKLGCSKVLKYNKKKYDENHNKREPIMDINQINNGRRKNIIKVTMNE